MHAFVLDKEKFGRKIFYGETVLGGLMSFLSELWDFLRVRKKFWLLPILFVMGALAVLIIIGGNSAVAPFIYTLF